MYALVSIISVLVLALPQDQQCWNNDVYNACKPQVNACWAAPWVEGNQQKCEALENGCQAEARACGGSAPNPPPAAPVSNPSPPAGNPSPPSGNPSPPAGNPSPPAGNPSSPSPAVKANSIDEQPDASTSPASGAVNRIPQKASTTNYGSSANGACEFPNTSKGAAAAINHESYFPPKKIAGHANIGEACNTCWQLSAPGLPPVKVTITDNCPDAGWCTLTNGKNSAGYGLHFDLNRESDFPAVWKSADNPIVDAVPVDC